MTTWNDFISIVQNQLADGELVNLTCEDLSNNRHPDLFLDGDGIAMNIVPGSQYARLEVRQGNAVLTKEELLQQIDNAIYESDCGDADVAVKWIFVLEKQGFFGTKKEHRFLLADSVDVYVSNGRSDTLVFSADYFMDQDSIVSMMSSM